VAALLHLIDRVEAAAIMGDLKEEKHSSRKNMQRTPVPACKAGGVKFAMDCCSWLPVWQLRIIIQTAHCSTVDNRSLLQAWLLCM
jgi:hypothetical protein